jgi:transposase InsO family protein
MSNISEQNEALRRFTLISPLLEPTLSEAEASARRRALLSTRTPEGLPVLSARTLRRWQQAYQSGGLEALRPHHRRDYGVVKTITPDVLDAAIALKEELPTRSVRAILEILEQEGLIAHGAVNRATLDRHLRRVGVMSRRPRQTMARGARRFQKAHRNQLWQADLKYGPYLPDPDDPRKMRRTYLLAFIDDATRLVPYAAFFFAQREYQLEQTFKWAVLRYGLPDKVYVDNGKIFISEHFKLACARLNIQHAHTAPFCPEAKGKIERFMGRIDSFINEIKLAPSYTLDSLNDTFSVWLTDGYNNLPHAALDGRTPQEVFNTDTRPLRPVEQQLLHDVFLREDMRKVDKTGCVKFRGALVEIGATYVGKRIVLRYAELPCGPHEVTAYDGDRLIGQVKPLEWNRPFDPDENPNNVNPDDPFADHPIPTRSRYLDALAQKGAKRRKAQGGIHFRELSNKPMPVQTKESRDV